MNYTEKLLNSFKKYKDSADSYHYKIDERFTTPGEIADGLLNLRILAENSLPELAVMINNMPEQDFASMYSSYQSLHIDDYSARVELYKMVVHPSENQSKIYNQYVATVKIQ